MTMAEISRRQLLGYGAALGATGLGLGACGSSSGSPGKAPSSATTAGNLTFVGADNKEAWTPLIKGFQAKYPAAHVNYQYIPFANYQSTIIQRLSTKDAGVDVLYVDPPTIADYVHRGFLRDLTRAFGDQPGKALLPTALAGAMYQDKMWTMPIWTSSQLLFYNVDILKAAGIPLPTTDPDKRLTWEEIREQGQRARERGHAKWGFAFGQPATYYQLQPLSESAGGGSGLSGDCGIDVDITNDGWLKAGRWYHDMHADGISPRGLDIGQTGQAFLNGEVAFYADISGLGTTFSTNKKLNWGIAAYPFFAGGKAATPTDSWHFGINTASKNADLARTYLAYAGLTTEGSLQAVETIPLPPCNAAAFAQFQKKAESSVARLAGSAELLDYELAHTAVHRPSSIGYTTFEAKLNQAWSDIRTGAAPDQVFDKTQQDLEQQFERLSC